VRPTTSARTAVVTPSPRASILIGSHNNAETIRHAVTSMLCQTIADIEVIVLDDGSSDNTLDLVRTITDPRVRCVALRARGIPTTLNEGLRLARAEIVAIQDADDWSDPDRLARQVATLERCPDVAVVGVRMHEVDRYGRPRNQRTGLALGDVGGALMRFNPLPNGAAAFRRNVVMELGGYDVRYRYASDYDLWLRIAEWHRVVVLDEVLATRVLSGDNASSRYEREQIAESLRLRVRAVRRAPRRWLRQAPQPLLRGCLAWATPLPLKRRRRAALGQAP
jgi:glycosyltransferase involved in cell wall biosynthesis